MKPKQLANVLLKILGFSVCLYAVPTCVSGIIVGLAGFRDASGRDIGLIRLAASTIAAAVQAVIGIVIICSSEKIANWMLKNSDE